MLLSFERGREESGVILIITCIALIVILAMSAVAVDAVNLYRHKLELQKAVDAAVLGGLGYGIQMIGDPDAPEEYAQSENMSSLIEGKAQEIFEQNLLLSNIELDAYTCPDDKCFTYTPSLKMLSASAQLDVDLLLVDAVPWEAIGGTPFKRVALVAAASTATRGSANMALFFDVSGSMRCPAGNKDCNCNNKRRGCEIQAATSGTKLKIDTLIDAVQVFASYYDEGDRVSIVPFSMRGLAVPQGDNFNELMKKAAQGNTSVIKCLLSGFASADCGMNIVDLASDSNLCDALQEGFYDMSTKEGFSDGKEEVAAVVFVDGAPTAATLCLGSPTPQLPVSVFKNDQWCDKSYISFTTRWQSTLPEPGKPLVGYYHYGPSLLVRTQSLGFHWPFALPPDPDPSVPEGKHVPTCHSYVYNGAISQTYPPAEPKQYYKIYQGCVQNLGFKIPGDPAPATVYAQNLLMTQENSETTSNWQKLYYLCPLMMADVMRKHKWSFFVVGVGYQDAYDPAKQIVDPFQDPLNNYYRKDVFNARLANDYHYAEKYSHPQNWNYNTVTGQNDASFGYDQWTNAANRQKGEYYASPNELQLPAVYRTIGKKIALRLIQ